MQTGPGPNELYPRHIKPLATVDRLRVLALLAQDLAADQARLNAIHGFSRSFVTSLAEWIPVLVACIITPIGWLGSDAMLPRIRPGRN